MSTEEALTLLHRMACVGVAETSGSIRPDTARVNAALNVVAAACGLPLHAAEPCWVCDKPLDETHDNEACEET
jgi:hypothetical protein